MLNQIKAALDLKKEIPDAVGYDTFGPITFPLPLEIRNALPHFVSEQIERITLLNLRIDNYSSKMQRNVRVLFSGNWSYAPQISFYRRDVEVKYKVLNADKEIVLLEIPPNESVSIEIFNPSDQFKVEQVLIGDVEVTKLMQKLAEARRHPDLAKFKAFMIAVSVFAIATTLGCAYVIWNQVTEQRTIEAAHVGLRSCAPYVHANQPGREDVLERKFHQAGPYFSSYILFLNKVTSLSELKIKDQVVLCDPPKP